MNSLLTREDILRADREAAAVAHREPSILFRLFSGFGKKPPSDLIAVEGVITAPIVAVEEIKGNGMMLELILKEFCEHLELDSTSTLTHEYLAGVRRDDTSDVEEFVQLRTWLEVDILPKNFRRVFVDFIVRFDGLKEQLENMSQCRWERLRTWSHGHV